MLNSLKAHDEEGRARALERLDILDSNNEQSFNNITTLVKQVLSVPMCSISLVDRDRQWFKASEGVLDKQTARDISFCTHTIQQEVPMCISDALEDIRFSNSPIVTGAQGVRSYVGIPLKTPDGYNIGALCAMDSKPREFQMHEIEILKNFAKMVISEIELRDIASTDAMTGAMSRGAWTSKAITEVERSNRQAHPLSLLLLDIDKFKSVNDTYGHPVGDKVIVKLSDTFRGSMRKTDVFGRYGGEEFVMLLLDTDLEAAMEVAERYRADFGQTSVEIENGKSLSSTISIGVAELIIGEDLPSLILRADEALYEAKESGRNKCVAARTSNPEKRLSVA